MKYEMREIEGFPGYKVDNFGNVWSFLAPVGRPGSPSLGVSRAITKSKRLLKTEAVERGGHLRVTLCRDRRRHRRFVHTLVLEAFVGPRPKGMEACHYPDRSPSNNALGNLRWGTKNDNSSDSIEHGTQVRGVKVKSAKLTDSIVAEIREAKRRGVTARYLANKYGVSKQTIDLIFQNRTWKHVK